MEPFHSRDLIRALFECLKQEEHETIVQYIIKKAEIEKDGVWNTEKEEEFINIIDAYKGDFTMFAKNWIPNKKMEEKYISHWKGKKLKKLLN